VDYFVSWKEKPHAGDKDSLNDCYANEVEYKCCSDTVFATWFIENSISPIKSMDVY